ncbi:hypothetical protein [Coleofasciculus chthonoplastes]|uniref:hypothetical protein n=1 Tax=Coleofasciculus chthonoplastes TaxID=64178 RepID=UPI001E438E8C|nr:hypothetical protein [Coleofasciculus chthonoplastes]
MVLQYYTITRVNQSPSWLRQYTLKGLVRIDAFGTVLKKQDLRFCATDILFGWYAGFIVNPLNEVVRKS